MWLWIIAVLLLGLVWGLAWFASLPLVWPIVASTVIVLTVVGILVYRRWRARAAARALERELMKQSDEQAARAGADRRAEIVELKAQVQRGIQSLQQSKLGEQGRNALYALPWYMIVGPPGAGKTTALRHSGLDFPFLDPTTGGGVKGIGGTRNCDWWFTNDAILLDTAGRYTTQEDDRPEWFAFLDMLRKYRKRRPVNGVILAVSAPDLLDSTDEQLVQQARSLRSRLDELQTRLDMVVPVYVMFTKTDLVGGFVEFFDDMRKSDRDRVFGATYPLEVSRNTPPEQLFEGEFAELVRRMHARALDRLRSARPEQRDRAHQFPLEFNQLERPLSEFIATLFEERGTKDDEPIFRGFYFTSGTQEGNPLDRVVGGLVRAFGLSPRASTAERTEGRSFFVTDLFRRVVFPDAELAGRTGKQRRRQTAIRVATLATAALLALLLLVPGGCTFRRNLDLVDKTEASAARAMELDWSRKDTTVPEKADYLTVIRSQLRQLDAWEQDLPLGMSYGMYVGDDIFSPLASVYAASIERGLKAPAEKRLIERLNSFKDTLYADKDAYGESYDTLKLYLMLTMPERLDPEWAAPRLARVWADALEPKATDKDVAALEPHTRYYLELMKRGEVKPWERSDRSVLKARSALLRAPRLARLYEALVRQANQEIDPILHSDIFYGSIAPFVTYKQDLKVEGAYTKDGWARVRKLLGDKRDELTKERWVLGEPVEDDDKVDDEVAKLKNLYFARYIRAWADFISDVDILEPDSAEVSRNELTALTEPKWPYLRLLEVLEEHVTLDISESELVGVARTVIQRGIKEVKRKLALDEGDPEGKKERPISPVEEAFKPMFEFGVPSDADAKKEDSETKLDTYIGSISKLVALLADVKDSETPADPSTIAAEYQEAYRSTSSLLTSQTSFTRPLLSPLLMRPITYSWGGVIRDVGSAASGLWEINVWSFWHQHLEGRYPFELTSKQASLEDFNEFFKPNGLLWTFYKENLAASLRRSGDSFIPKRKFRAAVRYKRDFLRKCMMRGAEITRLLYPPGSEAAKVPFEVNLHSVSPVVSKVTIDIDGAAWEYQNHPEEWLQAVWPAESAETRGSKVSVRGFENLQEDIYRRGDFGFYLLMESSSNLKVGRAGGSAYGVPTLVSTWNLQSHDAFIKVDFKVKDTKSLQPVLFRGYDCPRLITY